MRLPSPASPPPSPSVLPLPGAELLYWPCIGRDIDIADLFGRLREEIDWRQESITLFGKTHLQPRLICWMGDPGCSYRYSGKRWEPQGWHRLVAMLRDRVERLAAARFNSVLLNYYRDGQDSMGYHADDEAELGPRPIIASLSLGAERIMHLRHRHDRSEPTRRIALADGSLLVMRGDMQANWKHAIPKRRSATGPRINLTFRMIMGRAISTA
ncbi:MAG: alpha-ketoglutarate-dependent dioxygenase AlkB [Sphingobium sp.]